MSSTAGVSLRFRFGSVMEAAGSEEMPSLAFKLLILFILVMYSSIGVLFPAVEAVRPAMVIAGGAIVLTMVEVSRNRRGFRMAWPESAMLAMLFGVSAVSSFDAIYLRQAFDTMSNLAKIALIYVVIENTVTTESRLRTIMMTMVIGGLMPALGTLHHYLSGRLIEQSRAAWVGVFANPNENAYSLAILVPMAAVLASKSRWWLKVLLWGAVAAYVLGIVLTFSRGGLVGLFVVLGVLGWKQRSIIIKGFMIGGLVAGILGMSLFWTRKDDFKDISKDTTFNQRIATFKAGIAMFADKPLFGVGPGCSIVAYPLYVPKDAHCGCQDQLVIHNAFIQILSEVGALGFLPFMTFLIAGIFHARKLQQAPSQEMRAYAMGLEVALWGFMACGLSGGFSWSWFPYILVGLVVAARQIAETA